MNERRFEQTDPIPCFQELSPVTQRFLLLWMATPWTAQELLEDDPNKELIMQEIKQHDLLLLD